MTTPTPGQHVRIRPGHPTGWGGAIGTVHDFRAGIVHVELPHCPYPVIKFALRDVEPGRFVDGQFVPDADVPDSAGARDGSAVWDGGVAPGGFVCAVCGVPVESEPCPEQP